nr:centrosomal protein of 290 kDa-like isoform X2 [Ipomoea batatas]
MADQTLVTTSSPPLELDYLRSRIGELRDVLKKSEDAPEISSTDSEKLLNDCAVQLESKINQMLSDASDLNFLADQDLDEFVGHLKKELSSVEGENEKISHEIEELSRRYLEDLSNQLEKSKTTLKTLQDLEGTFKRFDAIEKVEDVLSGLRVIEFDGNHIRLSLRTYIPDSESLACQEKVDDSSGLLEQDHELLIEFMDGTMELKWAEIFPNDVHISEIIDAAKSLRQLYSPMPVHEIRAYLEWFVRRVQDRIVLCKLRQILVKSANKSRHSFEYLDRDEIIVAHLVGGIDAFIKVPQGWPIYIAALNLISLKSSSQYLKEISLSVLCKVVDMANSLDTQSRQSISGFMDRVEEILMQQISADQ